MISWWCVAQHSGNTRTDMAELLSDHPPPREEDTAERPRQMHGVLLFLIQYMLLDTRARLLGQRLKEDVVPENTCRLSLLQHNLSQYILLLKAVSHIHYNVAAY